MTVTSAANTLDRLADAVAERLLPRLVEQLAELLEQQSRPGELVAATTLADVLGITRDWVYAHADELGAIRLGNGDKPRLRFDVDRAREALAGRDDPTPVPTRAAPRPRRASPSVPLLPVRGGER